MRERKRTCTRVCFSVCVCKKKKGRNHTWEIKERKKCAGAGGFSETLDAMCRVAEVTWCTFSVAVTLLSSSGEWGGLHKWECQNVGDNQTDSLCVVGVNSTKAESDKTSRWIPPLTATLQASYSPRRASPPGFYWLFIETCTMLSCLNFVSLRLFTLLFV